jgi:glucosyl-3-phosphoglycerate synthase
VDGTVSKSRFAVELALATGQVRINPAFLPQAGFASDAICKSNVLRRFLSDTTQPTVNCTWAVGDNLNDIDLLRLADHAFAIDPKSEVLTRDPRIAVIKSFDDLLALIPNHALIG